MPRGLHLSSYGARSKVSESANAARASVYNANVGIMSASEPAGVALERRPSRLLSLPRSRRALGNVPEVPARRAERGRSGAWGGSRRCDAREGLALYPWTPQRPMARRRRKSEAVPPANQGVAVGAHSEARGGCEGLTNGSYSDGLQRRSPCRARRRPTTAGATRGIHVWHM